MTESEFPRCIRPNQNIGDPMLVISCDASNDACEAIAYA